MVIPLTISLTEDEWFMQISFDKLDRLNATSLHADIRTISESYGLYSDLWIDLPDKDGHTIKVPKILMNE